jgi:hypothetical protein
MRSSISAEPIGLSPRWTTGLPGFAVDASFIGASSADTLVARSEAALTAVKGATIAVFHDCYWWTFQRLEGQA